MATKNQTKNNISFYIAAAVTIAVGYGLAMAANMVYFAKLTTIKLPLGDPTLILGGMYFAVVLLVGILIAYFYEKFSLV